MSIDHAVYRLRVAVKVVQNAHWRGDVIAILDELERLRKEKALVWETINTEAMG